MIFSILSLISGNAKTVKNDNSSRFVSNVPFFYSLRERDYTTPTHFRSFILLYDFN